MTAGLLRVRLLLIAGVLCGVSACAQAPPQMPDKPQAARPSFQASGMQGTTAPSGYAAGLDEEDAERAQAVLGGKGVVSQADCTALHAVAVRSAQQPTNVGLLLQLGRGYLDVGDPTRAEEALERAHRLAPGDPAVLHALAEAYLTSGRFAPAKQLLLSSPAGTQNAVTWRLLGQAEAGLHQPTEAIASFQRSLAIDSRESNSAACGEAMLRVSAKDAVGLFIQSVGRFPSSERLWTDLGAAQIAGGQKESGAHTLLHAADLDPTAQTPFRLLAGMRGLSVAQQAQIVSRVQAFVVTHPNSADAHYDYALSLWTQAGGNPSAITAETMNGELQRSLALQPEFMAARRLLGVVAGRQGKPQEAVVQFTRVVQRDPDDSEAHYLLAMAYRDVGDKQHQQAEMTKFMQLKQYAKGATQSSEVLGHTPAKQMDSPCPAN